MALASSSDWSLKAAKPRSLMLKDYLLRDEISSSSSTGFRSFPRRQCCTTTVRFLLEIDLKVKDSSVPTRFLSRTASRKLALSTISTLQKASGAVVKAFKQFSFPSATNRNRKPIFPRKLLLRAFWKKANTADSSTRRWKSFQEFLDEKEPPSPRHQNRSDSAACTAIAVTGRNSISSCSNSNSWTDSEFASEMIPSSSGNSESSSENDAVKDVKDSPDKFIGKREGTTFGKDSVEEITAAAADAATTTAYRKEIAKEQWRSEEEKEQFSPVSVLDFPFDDEDQHISSSFNCKLHLIEGKKQKNPQKTKRFENGAELEPLDLKKRFADLGLGRDFRLMSKTEHQREEKAFEILNLVKSRIKSECFIVRTENLLLDFFHERLEEIESTADDSGCRRGGDFEAEVLKLTEDWIDGGEGGETALMTTGWEVAEGRSLYVIEMEKAGKWRSFAGEKEELASEFEAEVWISLLHELLIDLS